MADHSKMVTLRDSTLREGRDTPGVTFSTEQKLKIARALDQARVPEIEIVAPARVLEDLEFAGILRREGLQIKTSGLIYSYRPQWKTEVEAAAASLDRFDILMPVSPQRKPFDRNEKIARLLEVLDFSLATRVEVGVGFPHSTQVEVEFLLEIAGKAIERGARRVIIYDTNGSADPFAVHALLVQLRRELNAALYFHGHNDLGLAVANSLAAIHAGADGLDVTVNGLGDRAGNASLEQVALNLHIKGFVSGIDLEHLPTLSKVVAEESGIEVSKLAPVIGEFVLCHRSASHLGVPELFEAFDPQLVGLRRKSTLH